MNIGLEPEDFVVVLSLSRVLSKCASDSLGVSLTDFRVLAHVIANDGACSCSEISAALILPRSTVSTSLRALEDQSLVNYRTGYGERKASSTLAGRTGFNATRSAMRLAIYGDTLALRSSDRDVLDHYMVIMADRLDVPIISGNEIDMVLVYAEVNCRVKQLLKESIAPFDLTANEFLVLGHVAGEPDGERPSKLARLLRLRRPIITKVCKGLVSRGLAVSEADSSDARGRMIFATAEGSSIAGSACAAFWERFSANVRAFSAEELGFFHAINARLCA